MFSCPRCKHILSADATQCERCGEILPAGRAAAAASLPPDAAGDAVAAEDRLAEVIRESMPSPFRLTPVAKLWMGACVLCALVSGAFAFASFEQLYIIIAFGCLAMMFVPVLLVILGQMFAMALVARRELTWVTLGVLALAGLGAVGWGLSRSNMSMNFSAITDMLTNRNFALIVITLIVVTGVLAVGVPLARGAGRTMGTQTDIAGFKAETEREVSLKFNENETDLRMATLKMQQELELRKLDLEERRLEAHVKQVEMQATSARRMIEDRSAAVPRARLTNRTQQCDACGTMAYFSDLNLSANLCDSHNTAFAQAFRRCTACQRALPVSSFADDGAVCRACGQAGARGAANG